VSGHLPAGAPTNPERVVALYGGSFNPPHVAHLLAGAYVLATHDVDLWLLPCAHHPFGKDLASFAHRTHMCTLMADALGPRASVCTIEEELGGAGRTIDTVLALQQRHPRLRWRLVVGSDILHERHKWKRWEDLERLAPPLLLGRGGVAPPPGFHPPVTLPEVSSTEVRRRLAAGLAVDPLVPRAVLAYLRHHDLFGARDA